MWSPAPLVLGLTGRALPAPLPTAHGSPLKPFPLKSRRVRLPATLAPRGIHLALAPFAWLLVVAVPAEVGQDPSLFALLLEALEGTLKTVVVVNCYFRHSVLTPGHGPEVELAKDRMPYGKSQLQPGGHWRGLPPRIWACKWKTVWPPSWLVLIT